ncbi:hypothetical protein J6590_026792 [Homalodisca vitripennis]|nr:hypothetical protein J6590_026792 [Homalodisca vitripennis]
MTERFQTRLKHLRFYFIVSLPVSTRVKVKQEGVGDHTETPGGTLNDGIDFLIISTPRSTQSTMMFKAQRWGSEDEASYISEAGNGTARESRRGVPCTQFVARDHTTSHVGNERDWKMESADEVNDDPDYNLAPTRLLERGSVWLSH